MSSDDFSPRYVEHLASALDMISNSVTRATIAREATLSLCAETIARTLADAAHLEAGAEPRPFRELLPAHQERFRHLAEQAIESLDVDRYDVSIEAAINETLAWLEQGHTGVPVSDENMLRECLHRFVAHMNRPKVAR